MTQNPKPDLHAAARVAAEALRRAQQVGNATEDVVHIPPGKTAVADLDQGTLFYHLVKKGQPCAMSLASSANKMVSVSARIRVVAEDTLTLPDVAFWGGSKPDIKGHGVLTVWRIRILEAGQERIVWEAAWLPLVANG